MQRIAIPSYFYPTDNSRDWNLILQSGGVPGIAVINPNSGPANKVDPAYAKITKELQHRNIKVVGYVHTQYGRRDISRVLEEIQLYYSFYSVDGIFLDEISNTTDALPYYTAIRGQMLTHPGASLTILNPGTQTCEEYMSISDIVCNYEDNCNHYLTSYQAPAWVANYPADRFWHIVHSVTSVRDLHYVCKLSKERNAGYLFITSERMPNPYGKLPNSAYWAELTRACQLPQM